MLEPLPWHSTINRTRQLFGKDLFEELFNKVLEMCIDKGMVAGHTQAIDAAFVKANASLDSLEVKKAPCEPGKYIGKQHECRLLVTIYKDYYERTLKRVNSSFGRRMKYLQQSTVEPVFGSLINYYGMRKVNTHGIDLAHKSMIISAIAYNLKKYMKYCPKTINIKVESTLHSLKKLKNIPGFLFFNNFFRFSIS